MFCLVKGKFTRSIRIGVVSRKFKGGGGRKERQRLERKNKLECQSQMWFVPVIPAHRRLRQDYCKFTASLGYRTNIRNNITEPNNQA